MRRFQSRPRAAAQPPAALPAAAIRRSQDPRGLRRCHELRAAAIPWAAPVPSASATRWARAIPKAPATHGGPRHMGVGDPMDPGLPISCGDRIGCSAPMGHGGPMSCCGPRSCPDPSSPALPQAPATLWGLAVPAIPWAAIAWAAVGFGDPLQRSHRVFCNCVMGCGDPMGCNKLKGFGDPGG